MKGAWGHARMAAMGFLCVFVLAAARAVPSEVADAPLTGSIQGTVTLRTPPPRRTASRYPGARPDSRTVQDVPAVAYLVGEVPGGSGGPGRARIAQVDTAFSPAVAVVEVGGTVSFPNQDPFFHNVFSYSSTERFDLGRYPRGESKDVTFTRPGIVKVYCEVHDFMRAVVVVTENPYHAVVDAQGRFSMDGVPPGSWELVVWHTDLGEARRTVEVVDGGVARVEVELGP